MTRCSTLSGGKKRTEVALRLKVARASVNAWVAKYFAKGLTGLDSKKNRGRDSYLTTAQKQQLSRYIEEQCTSSSGGRLTGYSILKYIQHYLANRSFKAYEDIVNACLDAWNNFISDTKRVKFLCQRDWAKMTKC